MKTLLALSLAAALGAGCATVSPHALTADNPANPETGAAPEVAERPALMAGSEPLARWLATNRVDAAEHQDHSAHQHHGTEKAQKPAGQEHQH